MYKLEIRYEGRSEWYDAMDGPSICLFDTIEDAMIRGDYIRALYRKPTGAEGIELRVSRIYER